MNPLKRQKPLTRRTTPAKAKGAPKFKYVRISSGRTPSGEGGFHKRDDVPQKRRTAIKTRQPAKDIPPNRRVVSRKVGGLGRVTVKEADELGLKQYGYRETGGQLANPQTRRLLRARIYGLGKWTRRCSEETVNKADKMHPIDGIRR